MASDRVGTTSVGLDRKARGYKQRAVDEQCESRSSVDGWRFTDHTPLHHDEIGVNHSRVSYRRPVIRPGSLDLCADARGEGLVECGSAAVADVEYRDDHGRGRLPVPDQGGGQRGGGLLHPGRGGRGRGAGLVAGGAATGVRGRRRAGQRRADGGVLRHQIRPGDGRAAGGQVPGVRHGGRAPGQGRDRASGVGRRRSGHPGGGVAGGRGGRGAVGGEPGRAHGGGRGAVGEDPAEDRAGGGAQQCGRLRPDVLGPEIGVGAVGVRPRSGRPGDGPGRPPRGGPGGHGGPGAGRGVRAPGPQRGPPREGVGGAGRRVRSSHQPDRRPADAHPCGRAGHGQSRRRAGVGPGRPGHLRAVGGAVGDLRLPSGQGADAGVERPLRGQRADRGARDRRRARLAAGAVVVAAGADHPPGGGAQSPVPGHPRPAGAAGDGGQDGAVGHPGHPAGQRRAGDHRGAVRPVAGRGLGVGRHRPGRGVGRRDGPGVAGPDGGPDRRADRRDGHGPPGGGEGVVDGPERDAGGVAGDGTRPEHHRRGGRGPGGPGRRRRAGPRRRLEADPVAGPGPARRAGPSRRRGGLPGAHGRAVRHPLGGQRGAVPGGPLPVQHHHPAVPVGADRDGHRRRRAGRG